ncbi:MAG: hypothetical protein HQ567_27170 [Candidatus Nealsonbacteria bacterium]|nr:hypothetical protein [Candidatus Nealsonbacteria bacterium]
MKRIADRDKESRPARRRLQFGLRTLLLAVAVCAVACSWFAVRKHRANAQREAIEALGDHVWVVYDYELDAGGLHIEGAERPGPAWLRNLLGNDFFADAAAVWGSTDFDDDDMAHLRGFPRLRYLKVFNSRVTDTGLAHLKSLPELENLGLAGTKITDAGLVHLQQLPRLEAIGLDSTDVTDAGLVRLHDLAGLRRLGLFHTKATPQGIERLQQALPDCRVWH